MVEKLTLTATRRGDDVELVITAGGVTQTHIVAGHNLCARVEPFVQNALTRLCRIMERPLAVKTGALP